MILPEQRCFVIIGRMQGFTKIPSFAVFSWYFDHKIKDVISYP